MTARTLVLQLIMSAGSLMSVGFEKVWLLQTDLNLAASDVISVYVYQCFRLKIAQGSQHYTQITYTPRTSVLRLDRSHFGSCRDVVHERKCLVRPRGGELKLRVILDRFSVEVFVNDGEQALSAVIYTPQTAEGISFAADGQVRLEVEKYDLLSGGDV